MRNTNALITVAVLVSITTACMSKEAAQPNAGDSDYTSSSMISETSATSALTGEPKAIIEKLVEDSKSAVESDGESYYMSMTFEITADTCRGYVGFSADNFDKYVIAAASSKAAIGSQAHEIILIQCKDDNAAKEVKELVERKSDETDGGYDSMKWVCVWPMKTAVVESGSYVLIAASKDFIVDAAIDTFRSMAGDIGEVDVIYEHSGEQGAGEGFIAG